MSRDRIVLGSEHDPNDSLAVYHEGNGDPKALLLRISRITHKPAKPGLSVRTQPDHTQTSQAIAINEEAARQLFNFLGIWLHTR